jgi:hypothetical protein
MFHHMPKCGGTSFRNFLETVFDVRNDYIGGGGRKKNPARYEAYIRRPLDLSGLGERDCLAGHYNLPGSFLWERYPRLASHPHRKFTILRDPLDAAKSGVRFGIKREKFAADLDRAGNTELLMRRRNFFANILGITSFGQIEEVMATFWMVAPLEQIDAAAAVIAGAAKVAVAGPVERRNTTEATGDEFLPDADDRFRAAARLDYAIYDHSVRRFAQQGNGLAP